MVAGTTMALREIIHPPGGQRVRAEDLGLELARLMSRKRFDIILRIRHPKLDPAEITAALGWEPHRSWKAGDQSSTPKGTKLPGIRSDGLWSCTFKYKGETDIADKFRLILDHLSLHERLFDKLSKRGAEAALYVQLPGNTNIGDRLSWPILKKFVDLKIALEFEVFPK